MAMAVSVTNGGTEVDMEVLLGDLRKTVRNGVTRDMAWRKQQLKNLVRMIVEREQDFEDALEKDLARNLGDSSMEVLGIKVSAETAIKNLAAWTRPKKVPTPALVGPGQSEVIPEPYGVALVIGPWNFPIGLCLEPVMGAIAAGNAVVLKPSEVSPNCAAVLASAIGQYLDQTAVRVVQGGPEVAVKLLEQKWDKIFFTGGTEIGRKVALAAAKHLTPVTLELGGRNPAYLDESANLEIACQRLVWGMNMNAGQICLKPEYILVQRQLAGKLVETMKKTIVDFYGEDPSKSRDLCRIINDRHYDRLMGIINDPAVAKHVVHGGTGDKETRFIAPTVLFDVPWDSRAMQEETFGPITAVQPVDSLDEAIAIINDKPKPLALYIFSTKKQVIDRVIAETSSGGVAVNDTILQVANPHLPFGGVGESGMGAYHGKTSFDCFSHEKAILRKDYKSNSPMRYPPSTLSRDRMLRALVIGDLWGFFMYVLGFRK